VLTLGFSSGFPPIQTDQSALRQRKCLADNPGAPSPTSQIVLPQHRTATTPPTTSPRAEAHHSSDLPSLLLPSSSAYPLPPLSTPSPISRSTASSPLLSAAARTRGPRASPPRWTGTPGREDADQVRDEEQPGEGPELPPAAAMDPGEPPQWGDPDVGLPHGYPSRPLRRARWACPRRPLPRHPAALRLRR